AIQHTCGTESGRVRNSPSTALATRPAATTSGAGRRTRQSARGVILAEMRLDREQEAVGRASLLPPCPSGSSPLPRGAALDSGQDGLPSLKNLSCRDKSWAVRSKIREEASVRTGARRVRDFPNIHSASW